MSNQLDQIQRTLVVATGQYGFYHITSADAVTTAQQLFSAIYLAEDSVISGLEINGVSILADTNLTSKTLKAGITLFAPSGKLFSRVKLSSGSAILYNG